MAPLGLPDPKAFAGAPWWAPLAAVAVGITLAFVLCSAPVLQFFGR